MRLLPDDELERSSVVANAAMNRERGLLGTNSYERDLGLNALECLPPGSAWLDLCCGSGKALVAAAGRCRDVRIVGVDLVPMFVEPVAGVTFVEASVSRWEPSEAFDLITCVHGLHYVGDKLGLLARAAGWLKPNGMLRANFDVASVRGVSNVRRALVRAGFHYDSRRKIVSRRGPSVVSWPFEYVGADDMAGPNYTGQPAVASHYQV